MAWETDDSTGLLAHFVGTIDTSIWTTDSKRVDPNKPFLSWHVTVDDILQENFEGTPPESLVVNISIGDKWVEDEDGATVEHKDGIESFKGNSLYGKIISLVSGKNEDYGSNSIVKDGDGDIETDMTGVAKYMAANGYDDPRVAAIWQGLQFEFRGVGFRYRDTKNDDDVYQNVVPVRFLGVSVPGEAAVTKPQSAAAPEPVNTVGIWQAAGADDETAQTLNDLVNSAANHAAFAKDALLLDGVKDNPDSTLRDAVLDKSNFPS